MGALKGIGKVYLQGIADTYGSYAFGFLHTGKKPECAAALLHNDALPFYADHGLEVGAVLTDNGPEFCGTPTHPFELYLALNGIEHRRTKVRTPRTNGFIERFNRTILDEFFRIAFRENFYETTKALQADIDQWLRHYNRERSHRGYRNMGKRSYDTILEFSIPSVSDCTAAGSVVEYGMDLTAAAGTVVDAEGDDGGKEPANKG